MSKLIDVVVFGCTGFTGGLVAEYMARNAPRRLRWALAGRSRGKVEAVKAQLAPLLAASGVPAPEVVVADSADAASIDAMTRSARVVLSTVGPFMRYGSPLVEACVRNGADYVDTTGETPWVHEMIEKHHAAARACHTIIVPMCGFDSIPSDLGTAMMVDHVRATRKTGCSSVSSVYSVAGTASGGTIHTIINLMGDPRSMRVVSDNRNLCDAAGRDTVARVRPKMGISWDAATRKWTHPFLMAGANVQVVARSASLRAAGAVDGPRYSNEGSLFSYHESQGTSSLLRAVIVLMGLAVGGAALMVGFLRNIIARYVPAAGTGPSAEQRARSRFRNTLVAVPEDGSEIVMGHVSGGDPGYDETAKMVSEAALCLASSDRDRLPGAAGGVLTPAAAMGPVLMERLRTAGIEFQVDEGAAAGGKAKL